MKTSGLSPTTFYNFLILFKNFNQLFYWFFLQNIKKSLFPLEKNNKNIWCLLQIRPYYITHEGIQDDLWPVCKVRLNHYIVCYKWLTWPVPVTSLLTIYDRYGSKHVKYKMFCFRQMVLLLWIQQASSLNNQNVCCFINTIKKCLLLEENIISNPNHINL